MLGHPGGEAHSRYLIELSFLPPPARWLDMGAGDGSAVRLLKSLGYEADGIDLCPRGEDVTAGDYLHPPYPEGSFDGIELSIKPKCGRLAIAHDGFLHEASLTIDSTYADREGQNDDRV